MRRVIFKFDDFLSITLAVRKVDAVVKKYGYVIGWGCIGAYVNKWSPKDVFYIKKAVNEGRWFLFNHGWSHADREFLGYDEVEAAEKIIRTNDVVRDKIGYEMTSFGAPCNAISASTTDGLNHVDRIKYWFFGREGYNGTVFKRQMDMEYPLFHPNFFKFLMAWMKVKEYVIVLQAHPNQWNWFGFLNFRLICAFLKLANAKAVDPGKAECHVEAI